jgi:5-methylcytosine-specific restriction protein A
VRAVPAFGEKPLSCTRRALHRLAASLAKMQLLIHNPGSPGDFLMALKEAVERVLAEYPAAKQQPFRAHELADFLRHGFPEVLQSIIASIPGSVGTDYIVERSAGQGQWVFCPWVAVFDPLVTDSAERGYYPVYLFREDFSGLYFSLNQGVTDVREQYKARVKEALKTRAADFRTRLGKDTGPFTNDAIDLRPASSASYSADYEAGNIVAKFYSADNVPDEHGLREDVEAMLGLYEVLTYSVGENISSGAEPEEQDNNFIENFAAFRLHRRIERNPSLAKQVKEIRGYKCEACGFDFESQYPGIKKNKFIEAHHLVAVSELKGKKISRNPKTDFVVLCPNCHRMIHRYPEPWDLLGFRKTLRQSLGDPRPLSAQAAASGEPATKLGNSRSLR